MIEFPHKISGLKQAERISYDKTDNSFHIY